MKFGEGSAFAGGAIESFLTTEKTLRLDSSQASWIKNKLMENIMRYPSKTEIMKSIIGAVRNEMPVDLVLSERCYLFLESFVKDPIGNEKEPEGDRLMRANFWCALNFCKAK